MSLFLDVELNLVDYGHNTKVCFGNPTQIKWIYVEWWEWIYEFDIGYN